MLRSKIIAVVVLFFTINPCLAFAKAKATIDDIYPLYLRTGERGTLLVSGHGLKDVDSCKLEAVHGSGIVNYESCVVDQIKNSGQIQVSLDLGKVIDAGEFLLSLSTKSDKAHVVRMVTPIQVVLKDSSTPSDQTNSSAATVAKISGPYADCLNINPSKIPGLGPQNSAAVDCASSLLTNREVTDNFGGHVNSVYYAIQVRVANRNSNYDFLLRDILLTLPDGRVVSGRVRRFAQGVAVKGKSEDTRGKWYNWLQATSGLYGSLSVFSFASTDFKNVGNIFQGAFLAGFNQIYPDYTVDNVNRFNNAVFDDQKPSIVPKDSIGQAPLYVVALLPKVKGSQAYIRRFGEGISVALEGTFIKQISIVSLTPESLKFGPEYSLKGFVNLGTKYDQKAITQASPGQAIQISNSSSSPTTINKISISAGGKDSKDFEIITDQGTCGNPNPTTHAWDPSTKFTIPAQGSCVLYVRSTPQSAGPTSATVVLDGENLDGAKSVLLSGTGAGVLVDTYDASTSKQPFVCSMLKGSCTIDLGLVGTSVAIPIYYFVPQDAAFTSAIAVSDGTTLKMTECKPVIPASAGANPSCTITLADLDKNKAGQTTLNLALGDIKTNIILKYSITQTKTNIANSPALAVSSPSTIEVSVLDKALDTPVNSGNVMLLVDGKDSGVPPAKVENGKATISYKPLTAGQVKLTARYLGEGTTYYTSDSGSVPFTIKATPTISVDFGSPSSTNPISVAVTLSGPCTGAGKLSYQLDGGTFIDASPFASNKASITLGTLSSGLHHLTVKYSGDPMCSPGNTDDKSFTVSQ